MKKTSIFFLVLLFLISHFSLFTSRAVAVSPQELLRSIEGKSKELQELNEQIQETQKGLVETEEKSKTLNQEIKRADYRVSQLNLSIKSSQIKIEKLNLEIESLAYEISDKEQTIEDKKEAVVSFLRELQEKDRENTLMIFLKNKSLADGLFETQSISDLNSGLNQEIGKLREVKEELNSALEATDARKRGIETENSNLKNRKVIVEDQKRERQEILRVSKNQEKLYQEQLKILEKQQAEIAAEIEEFERELRQKIDPNLLPIPRPGVLAWPAGSVRISQGYGQTRFALYNYKGRHHNGVDIAGPIGTEIYASEAGKVLALDNQDRYCRRGAYGKYIVIKHENGLTTLYGHLSHQVVTVGQTVSRGQLIGYMGKTGWATGSHLHFTVWESLTYLVRSSRVCGPMPVGGDLDPTQYLERPPGTP